MQHDPSGGISLDMSQMNKILAINGSFILVGAASLLTTI
jgi:hypothetical protein